ncbi:TPA: phospholipase D family protein, partial [Enterobacter kobei]|nr:phospholipase D family protein [Enterobacter kobei]
MKRSTVSGLLAVCLIVSGGAVAQPTVQAGFSPEGSALQLVLNTIDTAQESIRLMGYSFTSPEVTRALIQAKQRGVDVKAVLDWKANSTKGSAG